MPNKYRLGNLQYMKNYRANNPIRRMLWNAKARCNKNGLEFNITKDDIVIPDNCPILGTEIIKNGSGSRENAPSLDRVDTTKGYIPSNVRVISFKANRIKSDLTLDQIGALYKYALPSITK